MGPGLSHDTNLYLASLLSERVRADRPAPAVETLAELHAQAAGAAEDDAAAREAAELEEAIRLSLAGTAI